MTLVFGQSTVCPCRGKATCTVCSGTGVAHYRHTDPDTSRAAARSISSESLRQSQAFVLSTLRDFGPMTDEQLFDRLTALGYPISPSGARTRRSELVALGLVRDSGKRRRLESGRMAIVWTA